MIGLFGCSVALATEAERAQQLEKLKAQFPAHLAGQVTEKSHPEIQVCYEEYRAFVDKLSLAHLAQDLVRLKAKLDYDIYHYDRSAEDGSNPFGSQGRSAARQNAQWLRQKMTPYLRRLVQFQQAK